MPRFTSTYLPLAQSATWLRGNHHGHSTVSDGQDDPGDIVAAYESEGYHYIALSEHDRLLPPDELSAHTSMCVVAAVEVTSDQHHTLLYLGADRELPAGQLEPAEIMRRVDAAGGLFVFDHPNWLPRPDYATDQLLDSMTGLRGMEIYCGVIERLPGRACATDRWDRLLGKGWRVYGHGTDDQHEVGDYFIAWNCVQWPQGAEVSAAGIVEALATGRFYASTGVEIRQVGMTDDACNAVVESDADEIFWIGRGGVILKKESGGNGSIHVDEVAADLYVRAECLGRGHRTAWTQPFWISLES